MPDHEVAVGALALIGGGEWQVGASFDAELLGRTDGEVVVLPTGAAYEHPERDIERASSWFAALGGRVRPAMVLTRRDAENASFASMVAEARFIYLSGGSPLHMRSVLKDSAVLEALLRAWRTGAIVAGTSAGAMVLTDPMVDPRGGAFTVGFGLVHDVAVIPHYTGELTAQLRRSLALAPAGCAVVALSPQSAILREPDGSWRLDGRGEGIVYLDHEPTDIGALDGRAID